MDWFLADWKAGVDITFRDSVRLPSYLQFCFFFNYQKENKRIMFHTNDKTLFFILIKKSLQDHNGLWRYLELKVNSA